MNNPNNKIPIAEAEKNSSLLQQLLAVDGVLFTLVFTVLSAVLCYPLLLNPSGHLYSIPLADKGTNLWNLWWVYYAFFERHVSPLWCDLVFYPWGGDLRFHTLSIVNGVLASPVTAVFGPVVSYNALFFVWTVFTGVFAALWGRAFGLSPITAIVLGFIATFHPFRWNHVEHLNLFSTVWMMAAFYLLELWMQKKAVLHFFLFLLVWGLALFSDWYFGLFVGIYFGLRLLVEMIHQKQFLSSIPFLNAILLPGIVLGGLVVWYFQQPVENLPYPVVPDDVSVLYSSFWSLSLIHFVTPLWMFSWLGDFPKTGAEFALHPGLVQLCIGVLGFVYWRRLSLSKQQKRFLILMILTFAVISLGPLLQVRDEVAVCLGYPVPMPAVLFEFIPGLTSMRVFTRFVFVTWMGVSMLGLMWLQDVVIPKTKKELHWVILGGLSIIFMVETQWMPLTVVDYEPPASIAGSSIAENVLELPIEPTRLSGMHLYHQTIHQQPIYAIEISRISTYREAYLAQFPFLMQISDYAAERNLTPERIRLLKNRFCGEISGLAVDTIVVTYPDLSEAWAQRRQDEVDALLEGCETAEKNSEK